MSTRLEDDAIQRYIQKCESIGMDPNTDAFTKSLRALARDGSSVYVDGGAGALVGDNVAFKGEALRPRALLNLHNQYRTTTNSAYGTNIIKSGADPSMDIITGSMEATWEKMTNARQRGVLHTIEVIISMSQSLRNKVVSVILFSPHVVKPDLTLPTRSAHLDHMRERDRVSSKMMATWRRLFREDPERIRNQYLNGECARDMSGEIVDISGVIRMIKDACTYAGPAGTVTTDPFIRLQYERAAASVWRGSHLSQEGPMELLKTWLYDIDEFASLDRWRFWDDEKKMFVHKGPGAKAPPATPMHDILHSMSK